MCKTSRLSAFPRISYLGNSMAYALVQDDLFRACAESAPAAIGAIRRVSGVTCPRRGSHSLDRSGWLEFSHFRLFEYGVVRQCKGSADLPGTNSSASMKCGLHANVGAATGFCIVELMSGDDAIAAFFVPMERASWCCRFS